MKPNSSFAATGFSVVRKWLTSALLLAVLVAGGLAATASTASAQSATDMLDPDNCRAGGPWVRNASFARLADDCRALIEARNTWVAAGADLTGTQVNTWGRGGISGWQGIQFARVRVGDDRNVYDRVVNIYSPHLGQPANGNIFANRKAIPGGLPASLCRINSLERIEFLALDDAWAGTTLPSCFSTDLPNLLRFHIENGHMGGTLGTGWCSVPRLGVLRLDNNQLSGSIPSCLGQSNGNQSLAVLQLNQNNFTGAIPVNLATSTALEMAWLSDNNLSGGLPGGWTNIISLAVGFNNLSGPLPSNFARGGNLIQFHADTNKFTGAIPTSWTSGANRIDRVFEFDVSDNRLSGVIDVDWLDAISFVNIRDYPLTVELDSNNFCFSSPRAIDATALVDQAANEMLSVPHQPGYQNVPKVPWLLPSASPRSLGLFNLRDQNCPNDATAESNLTPRQLTPTVTGTDSGISVSWDAAANPNTGDAYAVTFYEVRVNGPGDVSSHFVTDSTTAAIRQVAGAALDRFHNSLDILEGATAHSAITSPGSGATSVNLNWSGAPLLPAEEYAVAVWPWVVTGTLGTGFSTVHIPSDSATGTWQATNVRSASATEGGVLQGLNTRTAWAWNGESQSWEKLDDLNSDAPLAQGTGLLLSQGDPGDPRRAENAGTGRLGEGNRFTLYPGWNLMSPADILLGRELSSAGNSALFWEDRLWSCSDDPAQNHGGVAVILAYNAASNRWKAHVTCSPDLDLNAQGFIPLNSLDVSDAVFVYFNAAGATPPGAISWNNAALEYQAG